MAEHRHILKYFYPSYDCELIVCDCGERLGRDEILKRLNALEGMKDWQDGIYTGTQLRNYALAADDKPSADPS